MKAFFDLEFTGLHQYTTPISIGLVSADGRTFYAEFVDYDQAQIDDWLRENVIGNLKFNKVPSLGEQWPYSATRRESNPIGNDLYSDYNLEMAGVRSNIIGELTRWLIQFDKVEMWGDCLAYDWVLFCELFDGGAECLPRNVFYIPFDISTVFKLKGIDPDINRQEFVGAGHPKHNALWDAVTIKACYEGLMSE